jgi:hypothetical protein
MTAGRQDAKRFDFSAGSGVRRQGLLPAIRADGETHLGGALVAYDPPAAGHIEPHSPVQPAYPCFGKADRATSAEDE